MIETMTATIAKIEHDELAWETWITIRLENGKTRTVIVDMTTGWTIGETVTATHTYDRGLHTWSIDKVA